jgi:hypothetical protein
MILKDSTCKCKNDVKLIYNVPTGSLYIILHNGMLRLTLILLL